MALALISKPKHASTGRSASARNKKAMPGWNHTSRQFGSDVAKIGLSTLAPGNPVIQAKLKIGEPNNKYEQEADRVADEVMRMSEPQSSEIAAISGLAFPVRIQRVCQECGEELSNRPVAIQHMCPEYDDELHCQPMEGEEAIQARQNSGRNSEVTSDAQAQINGLQGSGQTLPESARAFFEPRFGYDLSQVMAHTGARAASLARAVNAHAFTVGNDILFGQGEFNPHSSSGRYLLAHELTHVVQQRGSSFPASGSNYLGLKSSSSRCDQLMRRISFDSDCSREGINNITRAQRSAARWARAGALALLNPDRAASLLNRHFRLTPVHAAAIARVRRTLRTIASSLDADAFTYHCRPDSDARCKTQDGSEVAGFAYPGRSDIYFCEPYPLQDFFGHRSLIATLLHEAAHAHDRAFNHDTYEGKNDYPPVSAITNAESYASFARDAALGVGFSGLELTLGAVFAAEPQFYIAVGKAGDAGGPVLDVLNMRLGARVAFTPETGEEPTRLIVAGDIGIRINPIRERIYVDITTGAFFGGNFTDMEFMAGIANRLTAGYRGERVDLGLDLSHFLDLVSGENLVVVGVRGALRF